MTNKTSFTDLDNHLFKQLERLSDTSLKGEALDQEINRGKAMASVAKNIVDSKAIILKAIELQSEYGLPENKMPFALTGPTNGSKK